MTEVTLRLEPSDEFCHEPDGSANFNESMYANVMAGDQGLGFWIRVGNRPGEGYAEVSCCVYLPDGRVGFMFGRPEISGNTELRGAGAYFEVAEPFRSVRMGYSGQLLVLSDPDELADPAAAFASNPLLDAEISVELEGLAEPFGGEPEESAAHPAAELLAEFSRGHYEQHVRASGRLRVGDFEAPVEGFGLRDHSWGPRYWQNVRWYRFLPISFGPDFGLCPVVLGGPGDTAYPAGMVLRTDGDGETAYVPITDVTIDSEYDDQGRALRQTIVATTEERSYTVVGEAMSLVPLRNRRKTASGERLETRITEAMTRFACDGRVGYGMSEYLDQIVDGVPVGNAR